MLKGYKTYLAALSLWTLAALAVSDGDWEKAATLFGEGLGLIGLRSALTPDTPKAVDAPPPSA